MPPSSAALLFIRAYQIVINPVKPIDCRFNLREQSVIIKWRNKNDHVCFFEFRVKAIHAVLKHAWLFPHRQVSQPIQGCTRSKAASKRKTVCPLSVAPRINSSASGADVPCLCELPVIATIYIVSSCSLQPHREKFIISGTSRKSPNRICEVVKQNLTTRQAAKMHDIQASHHGMAVCPFHNDKNPSMKVDKRLHCFVCQADGDTVDLASRL